MFENNLQKLTELASKLPQDQCDPNIEPTNAPAYENITGLYNSSGGMAMVNLTALESQF